jgi:hypothetical protein
VELKILNSALEETISFLRNSQSSDWAGMSVEELILELESEIESIKNSQSADAKRIGFLFAPTGPIQEISIDNGWGDEFLRVSEIVDQCTAPHSR